jgi:hypothetical protein
MGRACSVPSKNISLAVLALSVSFLTALASGGPASASQLVDRNATNVHLQVNARGQALITYRASGRLRRVLGWGAMNARPSAAGGKQVSFRLDYSGGWGTYHRRLWRAFPDTCRRYDGPVLRNVVAGCTAADGSYWALQSWRVPLPDLGFLPWLPLQKSLWLTLSHWSGETAELEVHTDWIYGKRFQEVFGRLMYRGRPVYGYHTTHGGSPTDLFGRLLYLDTLDAPAYGRGWRRENSFVTHKRTGVFCYGFFRFDPTSGGYPVPPHYPRHRRRGSGVGKRYRLTVMGPGVTPDISWEGPGLHAYSAANPVDVTYEQEQNAILDSYGDRLCRHH